MDSQFTIVIADDHPLFRGALYQAVHMAINDAQLLEADSIDSLTNLLGEHPEVDLLLLDLKMPGANGFEGLAHLRGQYPDLPIVVVSASEDAAIIQQVLRLGALGFIPKSVPMKELVNALNTVIGGITGCRKASRSIPNRKMAPISPASWPASLPSNTRC